MAVVKQVQEYHLRSIQYYNVCICLYIHIPTMLSQLINNDRTDKNTRHSYLETYEKLFSNKKETATNVLEVGIGGNYSGEGGGSIKLWYDYFTNAKIYALDTKFIGDVWSEIRNNERIILHTSIDAYDDEYFNAAFIDKNIQFDIVLDDGPHTLESMIKFIKLYSQIMKKDGILVIEDVQEWDWIEILKNEVPDNLKKYIKVYDLRHERPIDHVADNILFTIDLSEQQ